MKPRKHESPVAFKQALEQRLKSMSKSGADFSRRRQLLVFDRFLARISKVIGDAVILKGGLALELRLERARTTKDIDLRMVGSPENVLEKLQLAGRLDLGDFMTFEVQPDAEHPEIQTDGMKYDGLRHKAEGKLAGKPFGMPFGVDVAFADPITGSPDEVVAEDIMAFAGIAPPVLRIYPVVSHIAEKLHAYTMPRKRENSRVKDLPDLALLGKIGDLDGKLLRKALRQTFNFRETHPLPSSVPEPPALWRKVYERMASEDELPWPTLPELVQAVKAFLDPVLGGQKISLWSESKWTWT